MDQICKVNFDAPKITNALMDNPMEIRVLLPMPISLSYEPQGGFKVAVGHNEPVEILEVRAHDWNNAREVIIRLTEPVDVTKTYRVCHPCFQPGVVMFRKILDREEYIYTGDDLGSTYTPGFTRFRVWAPTANRVEVMLYEYGWSVEGQSYEMQRDGKGTWVLEIDGDLHGKFYTYLVHVQGICRKAVDPYVRAVNVNGKKGAILNMALTNPPGWHNVLRPPMRNLVDAIIYETHIRDISMATSSGITHRGKFLGLAEERTQSPDGHATGLAHLRELGITHLHLLPIMESEFIIDDESHYNWGYGTNFFFATEGQYATDPNDPVKRVSEFKAAVEALHRNGIRVVLDVVYNHTGKPDPDIERIVPGYYLRRNDEGHLYVGSGVNNDIASERPMVRKLIVDSVKYWAKEYRVDGFRFDLMGLHDRETMRQIEVELHKIDPTILLYGEAWNIPTGVPFDNLMVKNAQRGTSYGIFNDNVRDALTSGGMTPVYERGFASGKPWLEASIKKTVVGSLANFDPERVFNVDYRFRGGNELIETLAPHETVNYVSCHDNFALRDRLQRSNSDATDEQRQRMAMLANGIILTSQGIPFLQGGVEMYKTKNGDENSYQSPDYINEIDWAGKKAYWHMFKFYQGLIALRRQHPAFRMPTAEMVKAHLHFHDTPEGVVMFSLDDYANGDAWKTIVVVYNQRTYPQTVYLPGERWTVVAEDGLAGVEALRTVEGRIVEVAPISISVLYQE